MDRRNFLQNVLYNLSRHKAIDNARRLYEERERANLEVDLLARRINGGLIRYEDMRERRRSVH